MLRVKQKACLKHVLESGWNTYLLFYPKAVYYVCYVLEFSM